MASSSRAIPVVLVCERGVHVRELLPSLARTPPAYPVHHELADFYHLPCFGSRELFRRSLSQLEESGCARIAHGFCLTGTTQIWSIRYPRWALVDNRGGGDACVTEQPLDGTDVCSALQEVGREGVPEGVDRKSLSLARPPTQMRFV